jgi:cell division protein FtsB
MKSSLSQSVVCCRSDERPNKDQSIPRMNHQPQVAIMFRPACGRLLWVGVGVSAALAFSNALAQSQGDVIQRLQAERAHLQQKLDKLDKNSQTILTLQDEKVHLPYAADANKGADDAYAASTAKEIDQKIEKLKRENELLRRELNAGLGYVVSLAITSTMMIQDGEGPLASRDKRAAGTCPESIARPAGPGRPIVAPFSPPPGRTPTPPAVRVQSGGAGT